MKRFVQGCVLAMPLALLVLGSGCADPKKKIEGLTKEVEQLRADLATSQQERQRAMDALAKAQAEKEGLAEPGRHDAVADGRTRAAARQRPDRGRQGRAPTTKNGWVVAPGVAMISVSSDLLFGSGKADLTAAGKAKIAEIAREIRKEYASRDIYVIGHTDTDPIRKTKWQDNWELSAERALTVTRALQGAGVSGKQIMAAGRGEYQPRRLGKAKNRRVEIYAVERSGRSRSGTAKATSAQAQGDARQAACSQSEQDARALA